VSVLVFTGVQAGWARPVVASTITILSLAQEIAKPDRLTSHVRGSALAS